MGQLVDAAVQAVLSLISSYQTGSAVQFKRRTGNAVGKTAGKAAKGIRIMQIFFH